MAKKIERNRRGLGSALLLSAGLLAAGRAGAVPPVYMISDLGLGCSIGDGEVNSHGQVVTEAVTDQAGDNPRAFIWDSVHGATDLGAPKGFFSYAWAINSSGQVTGYMADDSSGTLGFYDAFFWKPTVANGNTGTLQGLPTLGGSESYAYALNDAAQVVGLADDTSGLANGFLWTATGGMVSLGILDDNNSSGGTSTGVEDINATGQTVGTFYGKDPANFHAFRHTGGGSVKQSDDLGTLGGHFSVARGINASGQVVGYATLAGVGTNGEPEQAFLYSSGSLHDLGTLGGPFSNANSITTQGQIVGFASTPSQKDSDFYGEAFLWTPTAANGTSGTMVDMNTLIPAAPKLRLTSALSINDQGQIFCEGFADGDPNAGSGRSHAILLTPISLLTITDLGTLGGNASYAYAINSHAQVVGEAQTASGATHAFLWDKINGMKDLGTLTGGTSSVAAGINKGGMVVGSSSTAGTTGNGTHAFLWSPTTPNGVTGGPLKDLGTLGGGLGDYSQAYAINDNGVITGAAQSSTQNYHAFSYDSTTSVLTDLDTERTSSLLGGTYSIGYALSTVNGIVAGEADTADGLTRTDYSYNGQTNELQIGNDTLPGGSSSTLYALSNDDSYAGAADTGSGETHAFRYDVNVSPTPNTISDLGTLNSHLFHYSAAYGVTDMNLTVGTSYTDVGGVGAYHAFLADGAATANMIDLNSFLPTGSGWVLQNATAINNAGQIVGYGLLSGKVHAFLLGPPKS